MSVSDIWEETDGPVFASGDQDYDSAIGWEPSGKIRELIAQDKKRNPRAYAKRPEILLSRTIGDWLKVGVRGEPAAQLFGPFWLEEEMSVLFSGTGTGKSALATQIAESIARGQVMPPFEAKTPIEPKRVLYLDFELKVPQLAQRYSCVNTATGTHDQPYEFSPNFFRAEMYWNGQVLEHYDGFSDMFFTALDDQINDIDPQVLIVDNITFLDSSSTSNANTALLIMRKLLQLQKNHFLSILVLAHTPKRRPWERLSVLDLQGSVNLANFADSIFALGLSRKSPGTRYLKQIKVRSGHWEFGPDRVAVYELDKYDHAAACGIKPESPRAANFLGFRFTDFAAEDDHLEVSYASTTGLRRLKNSSSVVAEVQKMAATGKGPTAIADQLGIPRTTVHRYIKNG